MSQEKIALAHRWFEEVWNQRCDETVDELLGADSVGHLETGDVYGVEGFKNARAQFLSALPDIRVVIEDTVEQGENVVIRWTVYGTHAGDGLGMPPTHRSVTIQGITWIKVQDGQFVEGWDRWNFGGFLANLQAAESAPDAA